ncbi:MAG: adenosine deaminase family protein [Deltaproteobacteria bacterium]|nr:adenosine deaminase family protein [Deltaproteobacteria bacterium]
MDTIITRELLLRLPKTDLHVHLDGSLRIPTLIDLARGANVVLPSCEEAGLRELVFKEAYGNLEEYLRGFGYTVAAMQTREALERVSYELAVDNQAEGVRYVEVRFAPQLHARAGMDEVDVLRAVAAGMDRAKSAFNRRPEVASGAEPPFEYGIIVCAMRYFDERFSEYYRNFVEIHRYSERDRVFSLAALETVQAAVHARDDHGVPVVGFDLAGPEEGYPPMDYREAYTWAHRHFLRKTVHAGEAYGPESIFQAITELHADRIGHGTSLLNPQTVSDPAIKDKDRYVRDLAQFIADRRITVEICLTSNQQTTPAYRDLAWHPFGQMLSHRISMTVCTDNRTVSNTTVTDELWKAATTFDLSLKDLKNIIVYGFKRSFFPQNYAVKREYVRRCMEYYEKVVEGAPRGA